MNHRSILPAPGPASRTGTTRGLFLGLGLALSLGLFSGLLPASRAFGQGSGATAAKDAAAKGDYLIGAEDVLSLSVWEHPELSRTVAVRTDGTFTFPPIGQIQALGRTTADLARDMESKIYNTLRLTTQVTVAVVAFNSQKIYLAGQVAAPGKYSFETIPNLVDLLGMTGGINAQADLSQVKILRRTDSGSTSIPVDLTRAVQTGDMSGVPQLQSGDLVMVPGANANTGALGGASVVYVLGEVGRPGPYNAVAGMDLMQLLAVAGGVTPRGDMEEVEVITSTAAGSGYRARVNLAQEIKAGRGGFPLRAGDTVIVPARTAGAGAIAWGVFREGLGVSRDVLNIFLIHQVLNP